MNLLIIPGNSLPNKTEAESMRDLLSPLFSSVTLHSYHHWETAQPLIDFEMEFGRLRKLGEEMTFDVVLGKSVGVTMAARLIHEGFLSPKACVFVGSSLPWAAEKGFDPDKWLMNFSTPSLFVQQTDDRTMSHAHLSEYIQSHSIQQALLKEVSGEDHMYDANEQLFQWIKDFLKENVG